MKNMTQTEAEGYAALIQSKIVAPFVKCDTGHLKGGPFASVFILVSLDARENWTNKILENSNYARFSIHGDEGKMVLFSGGSKLAKFRKCSVASPDVVVEKIQKWITESNALLGR